MNQALETSTKENKELKDKRWLCSFLAVKMSWVNDKVFRKEIPYLKVGNLIRFDEGKISKWLEEKNRHQ